MRGVLFSLILIVAALSANCQRVSSPSRWAAIDGLGRKIGGVEQYGELRKDKYVGIFYVVWHGAHGYDYNIAPLADESVYKPTKADSLAPYDIQKMLDANPTNPNYGPVGAFHHWGEPYLGYYVSNDKWVIRKHAQLLSDAGVDVIIIDVTNAFTYLPTVLDICEVYSQMRSEGAKTPQISFIFNSNAKATVQKVYDNFYAKGLYRDLWFNWRGKPLILTPPEGEISEIKDDFSIRHSWFCSAWEWFGDGRDRWPWADKFPQKPGWHLSSDVPEQVAISPATHAHEGIGRSYHNGALPDVLESEQGLCFKEQSDRALAIDPEFLMICGWNEWTAMRFTDGNSTLMCGKPIEPGDSYFVDVYNHEFSRDIEPLRGDFGDNYYYQMVDIIRRFKGVEEQNIYSKFEKTSLGVSSWQKVDATFIDDKGDTFHRNHHAYGSRLGQLVNASGENDIIAIKVANDGRNISFCVETADDIIVNNNNRSLRLFIGVNDNETCNWNGFQYMISGANKKGEKLTLSSCLNGWDWQDKKSIKGVCEGRFLIFTIPLRLIGVDDATNFTLNFKCVDNTLKSGDIQECLTEGDSAPNGRFSYRYNFIMRR